jgi:hypothetical protein
VLQECWTNVTTITVLSKVPLYLLPENWLTEKHYRNLTVIVPLVLQGGLELLLLETSWALRHCGNLLAGRDDFLVRINHPPSLPERIVKLFIVDVCTVSHSCIRLVPRAKLSVFTMLRGVSIHFSLWRLKIFLPLHRRIEPEQTVTEVHSDSLQLMQVKLFYYTWKCRYNLLAKLDCSLKHMMSYIGSKSLK